jgi:hypothetical protein
MMINAYHTYLFCGCSTHNNMSFHDPRHFDPICINVGDVLSIIGFISLPPHHVLVYPMILYLLVLKYASHGS